MEPALGSRWEGQTPKTRQPEGQRGGWSDLEPPEGKPQRKGGGSSFPPGTLRVLGHRTLRQGSEEGVPTESCAGLDPGEPLAGCGLLSQGRHIPRLDSPSWDKSQRCPWGSAEACSLTRTLIILRRSPGA